MNCPNCNQPYQEGATVCPNCGTLLPSSAPAPSSMPSFQPPQPVIPPPPLQPYMPSMPSSSGISRASLGVGIASVGLVAITLIVTIVSASNLGQMPTTADIERLYNSGIGVIMVGSLVAFPVVGLTGLILGIVGLSREKSQPTQNGRTLSIIGIVLSCIPLLCCLAWLVLALVSLAAIGSTISS